MARSLIFALALAGVIALTVPVHAAGAPASALPAAGQEEAFDAQRMMETPNIAVPIVRQGRLRNYVYVTVRITAAPGSDAIAMRDKGHFLRDALLRAVHRQDLAAPERDDQLNVALANEVFARVAREVLGANAVGSVQSMYLTSLRRAPR